MLSNVLRLFLIRKNPDSNLSAIYFILKSLNAAVLKGNKDVSDEQVQNEDGLVSPALCVSFNSKCAPRAEV